MYSWKKGEKKRWTTSCQDSPVGIYVHSFRIVRTFINELINLAAQRLRIVVLSPLRRAANFYLTYKKYKPSARIYPQPWVQEAPTSLGMTLRNHLSMSTCYLYVFTHRHKWAMLCCGDRERNHKLVGNIIIHERSKCVFSCWELKWRKLTATYVCNEKESEKRESRKKNTHK